MKVDICQEKCLACSNGGATLCRRYRHLVLEGGDMKSKIEQLVAEELARANEKFPAFYSSHEAYAVLLEEVEEALEELGNVEQWTSFIWTDIKARNAVTPAVVDDVKGYAVATILELIQVAAMCDKWKQFLERSDNCASS